MTDQIPEIISTRTFDAPRELVFKTRTDPTYLAQRWGPKGFTNTFHTFDLKPGGIWDFVMHGPDGVDYPNTSVFEEIVPLEKIVFDHVVDPKFYVIVLFSGDENKTTIEWHMIFASQAVLDAIKDVVIPSNEENYDRLQALLDTMI